MSMKPRKRKAGEAFARADRIPPAVQYVKDLDGEYYRLSEVAKKVGVAEATLRKLVRSPEPKVKAPSYVGAQGDMQIYLFTPEDVEEIKQYYENKYQDFDKPRGPGRPKKKAG